MDNTLNEKILDWDTPEKEYVKDVSNPFKCYNCHSKSTNHGCFYNGSNSYKSGQLCQKCEKEFDRQNKEDNEWYDSVRM